MALDYNYSKLKGKVIEKFGTRDKFASALNISRDSVSLKLNGKTPSSVHNIPFLKFSRCQFFVNYDKKEPSQREVIRFFFSNRY